jgi:peroxiredoxin
MADRSTAITPGETAPDFTLKDQDEQDFTLGALKGKRVLLSFHPLAATGFCTTQMKDLEANFDAMAALDTVPVGISVDAPPAKKLWATDMGVKKLRLLSDFWPHGAVSAAYGMFREQYGTSKRANVLVDGNGRVAWVKEYKILSAPDIAEVMAVLKK